MASLHSTWIKLETLEVMVDVLKKRNEKGIEITTSVNDDVNNYGQNVTSYVAQSKEEREEKKPKFYVGNGKTFWTDGKISVPAKVEQAEVVSNASDDASGDGDGLPF